MEILLEKLKTIKDRQDELRKLLNKERNLSIHFVAKSRAFAESIIELEAKKNLLISIILSYENKDMQKDMYSKEDILKAGEIGEVNHYDAKHIVSLLDEAKQLNKQKNEQ